MRYLVVCGLLCLCSVTHAQVYKRVDPTTGQITYTNVVRREQAQDDEQTPTRVPEQELAQEPRVRPKKKNINSEATSSDFPRVSTAEQKRRDLDRYAILKEELQIEIGALKAAEKKPASEDAARRHKANIASLERELSNLR